MTIEERAKEYADNYCVGDAAIIVDLLHEVAEKSYIQGATEQKAIDDAERKSLIEKVIWLIEDSYPETDLWTHSELVENVTRDLESRSDELKKMFDNS